MNCMAVLETGCLIGAVAFLTAGIYYCVRDFLHYRERIMYVKQNIEALRKASQYCKIAISYSDMGLQSAKLTVKFAEKIELAEKYGGKYEDDLNKICAEVTKYDDELLEKVANLQQKANNIRNNRH